jgi:ketol-acid reductoisomerase
MPAVLSLSISLYGNADMRVLYDRDADRDFVTRKKVAVIGYGSQGRAHALNLRDSGVEVVVGGRPGASLKKAEADKFKALCVADAARGADVVFMGTPDEQQGEIYAGEIAPHLKKGGALVFAHGFAIHYRTIEPRADLDVILVAPEGPAHQLRSEYERGQGLLCLLAVQQDATGTAKTLGLSYACALGCGRSGIMETTFREETETDLFGEGVVLCGGQASLIRAAYETLVEAGYAPEMAYFECLHQVKLLAELIYAGGIAGMNEKISNTAEWGEYVTGPRIINEAVKAEMKRVLADIQSGKFAKAWIAENAAGQPRLKAMRAQATRHPIEEIGARLRAMMPWLGKDRSETEKS